MSEVNQKANSAGRHYVLIRDDLRDDLRDRAAEMGVTIDELCDLILEETTERPYDASSVYRFGDVGGQRDVMVISHAGHAYSIHRSDQPISCRCCTGGCRKIFRWRNISRCGCPVRKSRSELR
jgi:hypothetical protein